MELNVFQQRLLSQTQKIKLEQLIFHGGYQELRCFREQIQYLSVDTKRTAYQLFLTKIAEIPALSKQLRIMYTIVFEKVQIPVLKSKVKAVADSLSFFKWPSFWGLFSGFPLSNWSLQTKNDSNEVKKQKEDLNFEELEDQNQSQQLKGLLTEDQNLIKTQTFCRKSDKMNMFQKTNKAPNLKKQV